MATTTDTYTATGTWTCPAGGVVGGTVTVECWGSGAAGFSSISPFTQGESGGGGGAYSAAHYAAGAGGSGTCIIRYWS